MQEHQHRYPRRQRTTLVRYGIDEFVDIAFLDQVQMEGPETIGEALKDEKLKDAADTEYQLLMDHETWKLVKLPTTVEESQLDANGSLRQSTQVMMVKLNAIARLVAKGYTQKPREDYDGTYLLVIYLLFVGFCC